MTVHPHRRRRWGVAAVATFLLLCSGGLLLYLNPFWLIDHGLRIYLGSHGVQERSTLVDGNRITYLEAKPAGSGPQRTLLLIHGLGARSLDWAPLIPTLAQRGYHVYALDLLGYGNSAKPADSDFSVETEEHVVQQFMQSLHLQRADVAGWSMGGWVAMLLTLDHPELVRRLVLLDSAGLYFDPDFDSSLFVPSDRAGLERLVTRLEPDTPNFAVPGWAAQGMLRRLQANRWIIQRSFRSMISGRSVVDFRLSQVHQPVLLLWGTQDKLTTFDQAERLHQLMPQSVLYGLSGCGHLAAAECTAVVVPLMTKFLESEPPQQGFTAIVSGRAPRH